MTAPVAASAGNDGKDDLAHGASDPECLADEVLHQASFFVIMQ